MGIKKRAIHEEDKLVRKQKILDSALFIFSGQEYESIRMDDLAQTAGMAKGTLYLYFKTKEALYLTLMIDLFTEWFEHFGRALQSQSLDRDSFVGLVIQSLRDSPQLVRLIMIQHSILEKNLDKDTLVYFKKKLAGMLDYGARLLENHLVFIPAGQGSLFFLFLYALIIGYKQLCEPNIFVKNILQHENISEFILDFDVLFRQSLLNYLNGIV